MHVKLGVHVRLFLFLVWTIPHIRYTKILTWLRGFLVIFLLVWFSLCSSWSLLEIARRWSIKETVILTLKPRIHVRIFNKSNVGHWTAVSAFFHRSYCWTYQELVSAVERKRTSINQPRSRKYKSQFLILCLQPRRQDGYVGGQNRRIFSRRIYLKIEFSFQKRQVKKKKEERNALVLIPQHHDGRRDVTCKSAIGIGKFKLCLQWRST